MGKEKELLPFARIYSNPDEIEGYIIEPYRLNENVRVRFHFTGYTTSRSGTPGERYYGTEVGVIREVVRNDLGLPVRFGILGVDGFYYDDVPSFEIYDVVGVVIPSQNRLYSTEDIKVQFGIETYTYKYAEVGDLVDFIFSSEGALEETREQGRVFQVFLKDSEIHYHIIGADCTLYFGVPKRAVWFYPEWDSKKGQIPF